VNPPVPISPLEPYFSAVSAAVTDGGSDRVECDCEVTDVVRVKIPYSAVTRAWEDEYLMVVLTKTDSSVSVQDAVVSQVTDYFVIALDESLDVGEELDLTWVIKNRESWAYQVGQTSTANIVLDDYRLNLVFEIVA